MSIFNINVNEKIVKLDVSPETPLLWALRDELGLVGTKYGCGIGSCGACTVHLNGSAKQSCNLAISSLEDSDKITTIEGISVDASHPVQVAWKENDVAQCGYCQSGQMMNAAAFLAANPSPSDAEIVESQQGNICRCITYNRIKTAIKRASEIMQGA